ncbi:MAG: sigma-70 family RNA polymerase sigma factor [Acidobacteriota bacterium]
MSLTPSTFPQIRPEPLLRLRRPAAVEEEIAAALALDRAGLLERASSAEAGLSCECLVHLVRHSLRRGDRDLAEALAPRVLGRAEHLLRGTLPGFTAAVAEEIREDALGRLAVLLAEPGSGADFFEVRFALAVKRLRLDVCRRYRRRIEGQRSPGAGVDPRTGDAVPPEQERRAVLAQTLARLPERERRVLVLHRWIGLPLASTRPERRTVASMLGISERTARNLLRRAEARLGEAP